MTMTRIYVFLTLSWQICLPLRKFEIWLRIKKFSFPFFVTFNILFYTSCEKMEKMIFFMTKWGRCRTRLGNFRVDVMYEWICTTYISGPFPVHFRSIPHDRVNRPYVECYSWGVGLSLFTYVSEILNWPDETWNTIVVHSLRSLW